MKCPACDGELTAMSVGTVTVDVCRERCGGVWFDAGEMERFDEKSEAAPTALLRALPNQAVAVDRNRVRHCPNCSQHHALTCRFFDAEHELQLDQCDRCHGVWVDLGELETIRTMNDAAKQRQNVVDDFYRRASDPDLSDRAKRGIRSVLELLFH